MVSRLPRLPVVALLLLACAPALAKDKGDTYAYCGFLFPSYVLRVDSLTAENDKEMDPATNPNTTEASGLAWTPKAPMSFAVGFSYRGFGAGTSFDIEDKEQQDNTDAPATKVETSYTSYDFSYFFGRAGVTAAYSDLQGLKLTNATGAAAEEFDPDGSETFRPDIRIRSKTASVWTLPLASNLKLDEIFDPAELSKGSGIGLIAGGSYNDMDLRMKRPLVEREYAGPFGADGLFTRGNFVTWSYFLGPAATLDFKGIYASMILSVGNGKERIDYVSDNNRKTYEGTSEKGMGYFATGYKGKNYFTAMNVLLDMPSYRMNSMIVTTEQTFFALTFGKRF